MSKIYRVTLVGLMLMVICVSSVFAQQIKLERMFPEVTIDNLLGLETPDSGNSYVYALSQPGYIYRLDLDNPENGSEEWLDISDQVIFSGEQGLLGLAFHPEYAQNNRIYINYIAPDPRRTVISRFYTNDGEVDPDSEEVILEFDQHRGNHNGGQISFGPDGYLHIASGDGGGSGDPEEHGQNTFSLLGGMLRIDVDQESDNGQLYSIPEDNMFADGEDGMPEIYAYGFRNPWRFSFDRETEKLWVADVGENKWEYIHLVEGGKNYGWNIVEGSNCFSPSTDCDKDGLEMPIYEYRHQEDGLARASITGGYVYRGEKNPVLEGKYVYGDFVNGVIWALDYDEDAEEVISNVELANTSHMIASFGEDANGEIYVLSYDSGEIFRILASPDVVTIISPEQNESIGEDPIIRWDSMPGAENYRMQISEDDSFSDPILDIETTETSYETELEQGDYYLRVRAENEAGEGEYTDPLLFTVEKATLAEEESDIPASFELSSAYPNPFNPITRFRVTVPKESRLTIEVFNSYGQRVGRITDQVYAAGEHQFQFDGSRLSSGMYVITARIEGEIRTSRVTLLK